MTRVLCPRVGGGARWCARGIGPAVASATSLPTTVHPRRSSGQAGEALPLFPSPSAIPRPLSVQGPTPRAGPPRGSRWLCGWCRVWIVRMRGATAAKRRQPSDRPPRPRLPALPEWSGEIRCSLTTMRGSHCGCSRRTSICATSGPRPSVHAEIFPPTSVASPSLECPGVSASRVCPARTCCDLSKRQTAAAPRTSTAPPFAWVPAGDVSMRCGVRTSRLPTFRSWVVPARVAHLPHEHITSSTICSPWDHALRPSPSSLSIQPHGVPAPHRVHRRSRRRGGRANAHRRSTRGSCHDNPLQCRSTRTAPRSVVVVYSTHPPARPTAPLRA